ncbi:diphospho-undecaprenol 4-alpha-N-acetylgalactosaminyltransferase [Enhygromyxa salina]|uniref:Diphospho-undecaprenol 4-alpha-N-acetylgalactosaminyltransferase n=1 Tax=Enhygromyxa salina TaxID=215803 RepID=A0A2S9YEB6_9BACT|nr:glycosyltransferase family 4 protein [Enhygromyxa salina]PRQ03467.1 diphospho-undecaprenol 4-alpha-N-acetylgalactosaminyltransferase [Enhygromyxa salina]
MTDELDPRQGPRRRVAHVITRSDAVGGAQVVVELLARGMLEAGHTVRVFVGGEGPFLDRLDRAGVPYEPLQHLVRAIDPTRDLRALFELRQALGRFDPDVVSAHSTKAGWFGRLAGRSLGVATVYTVHGWVFGWQPGPRMMIARALETLTAPLADAIIAVSAADLQRGVDLRVAPARKFHLVHNAIPDLPEALRADPSRSPARIIAVSRLQAPKDPLTLIEGLGRLETRAPKLSWELELIGDGPLDSRVREAVARHRLGDRVSLLGSRDDVPERLAKGQIFVLSSTHEGFPISTLEAMRAGLPVVASHVGGVAEAVVSGETGALIPASNPDALADALEPLIVDAELRGRQGAAGRAAYERAFTFETQLRRSWAVYERAIRARESAASPRPRAS